MILHFHGISKFNILWITECHYENHKDKSVKTFLTAKTMNIVRLIRAVAGQCSSPELCLANKTKMHLKQ